MIQSSLPEETIYLEHFYTILEKNTGISLDSTKEYLVSSRLSPIAKSFGKKDYQELLKQLFLTPLGPLHWQCFEAMTTNETMFFRDSSSFELLRKVLLPRLIEKNNHTKELSIWCAASSTGQEPYSISILLKENFPQLKTWKVNIKATDISQEALQKSRTGIYSQNDLQRGLTDSLLARYFTKIDEHQAKINDEMIHSIAFDHLNLIAEWPVMPKFDLILLRNVMIYFNQETRSKLLKRLASLLRDQQSILLLGSSETIYSDEHFQIHQLERVSYYQKLDE
jgi:chemotaxis protein methyltransferase CheR